MPPVVLFLAAVIAAYLVGSIPSARWVGRAWQLTDVQQEVNGLLTFDRRPKLPLPVLREIFTGIGKL